MAILKIKDFDFTDATDWTLTDSGVIVDDILTLPDEVVKLYPDNVRKWSPALPEVPADSDAYQPAIDQVYYAMDGGDPACALAFVNAEFGCYLKRDAASVGPLDIYARHNSLTGVGLRVRFHTDAGVLKATFYDENDAVQGEVTNLDDKMPVGSWVLVRLKLWQGRLYLKIGDRGDEDLNHCVNAFVDFQEPGTFALKATGVTAHWFVDGSTDRWPYAAERLEGRAYHSETGAYTLPYYTSALDTVDLVYDYTNDADGETITERLLYYVLYHDGAWGGSWIAVVPGADLSGINVDGGDKIRFYLRYSNHGEYRLQPGYQRIRLTYSVEWVEDVEMKAALKNLAALIDANETVSAYTGWHSVEVGLPLWMEPGYWGRCGVVMLPNTSKELGLAFSGGKVVKQYEHQIDLLVYMQLGGTLEDLVIGDNGLLDLTEDVKLAIRMATLGGTVIKVEVGDADYGMTIQYGPDPATDALPGNMVHVTVISEVFEAGT